MNDYFPGATNEQACSPALRGDGEAGHGAARTETVVRSSRRLRLAAIRAGLVALSLLVACSSGGESADPPGAPEAKGGRTAASKPDQELDDGAKRIMEWWAAQPAKSPGGSGERNRAYVEVEDTRVGEGRAAREGDTVSIHYTAKVLDGPTFEKTHPANPFSFKLGSDQAIRGLSMGIAGMKVGGTRKIKIPPALSFGGKAHGDVPPNSVLVYTVSLTEVSGSTAPTPAVAERDSGREKKGRDTGEEDYLTPDPTRWATDYSAARMLSAFTKEPIVCLVARLGDIGRLDIGSETWLPLKKKASLVWVDPDGELPMIEDERDEYAREVMKMLGVTGALPQVVVAQAAKDSSEPDTVKCRVLTGSSPADWVAKIDACLAGAK